MSGRVGLKGAAVAAAVLLAVAAGGGYLLLSGVERPTVESVETSLGTVSNETTTVHSTIVVTNPNDRTLPDVTVTSSIEMNDVRMGTGRTGGVQLVPGRNVINFTVRLDNGQVPAWWVSHVARGESTNLTTTASVSVASLPFGVTLPPRARHIETKFADTLGTGGATNVSLGNVTVLSVGERGGQWGEPTANRTPISLRTPLENRHNRTVALDGIAYTVRLNDVVVGEGTDDGFSLAPGERRTVAVDAHIDPARMERWWVSHLRANESTRLVVEVAGVVERDGERRTVPLPSLGTRATLETDLFGDGSTTVRELPTPPGPTYEQPCVRNRTSRWGEPTDSVTPIVTTVSGCNPNEGPLADLLRANVSQRTTIGAVTVADDRTVVPLPPGSFDVAVRSTMRNDQVPSWWAAHLNRGEHSTVETTLDGSADVGITTFPLGLADRERAIETEFLAGLNEDTPQTQTVEGRPAVTVRWTRATWANATPDRAPIRLRMRIHNDAPAESTIRDLNYTVRLGETTLADRESPAEWTFEGFETRTVETTLVLNNSRMADWWPGHVSRGERSRLRIDAYATVESGGRSERTRLDFLGDDRVVRTDLLGTENGSAT